MEEEKDGGAGGRWRRRRRTTHLGGFVDDVATGGQALREGPGRDEGSGDLGIPQRTPMNDGTQSCPVVFSLSLLVLFMFRFFLPFASQTKSKTHSISRVDEIVFLYKSLLS